MFGEIVRFPGQGVTRPVVYGLAADYQDELVVRAAEREHSPVGGGAQLPVAYDAPEQATALASRLPGADLFRLFLEQQGGHDRFRFGLEADGSPSGPWGWDDLD